MKGDTKWFENGLPLTYLPVPIPDPERPWGGECQACWNICTGHYLEPQQHAEFIKEKGLTQSMFKPPSAIIKEEYYESVKEGKKFSDGKLLEVARKTLLGIEELKMHVEHLKVAAERRKEGAKKAASTRKAKGVATKQNNKANKTAAESEYLNYILCKL